MLLKPKRSAPRPPARPPARPLCAADQELEQHLAGIRDASLRHTLQFGIGLHHAGLPDSDREVVERLFVDGKIQVCVRGWRAVGLGDGGLSGPAVTLLTVAACAAIYRPPATHSPAWLAGWLAGCPPCPAAQVLVATSTLAWGVNTPAHLVIIKGTEFYDAPTK